MERSQGDRVRTSKMLFIANQLNTERTHHQGRNIQI